MEKLTYNKDLYRNRKDLIPIILEKDKVLFDYSTNGNDGKFSMAKAKKLWLELNNLYKEINQANNIYYHENKWINDYCNDIICPKLGQLNLTGEKLIDFVVNELNKLDGIVIREIKDKETYTDYKGNAYRTNLHNYSVYIITPSKIYEYYLNRGYAGQFRLEPKGNQWTCNKFVNKHICELLYDGINLDESIYNDYLKKNMKA